MKNQPSTMVKRGRGRPRRVPSDHNLTNDIDNGGQKKAKSDGEFTNSSDYQLPEFFQFYLPSLYSERMKIPPAFIKRYGGNILSVVTLRSPSGQSWQVTISKTSEHWYFEQGWPEFVKENSLEDGDFLTFCYADNSVFSAKVFSMMTGCRRIVENASGFDGNDASEPVYAEKSKKIEASPRNLSIKSPIARKTVCRYPTFSVVVTKSDILKGYLHVPVEFCNVYMRRNESEAAEMATLRINDKSWPLGLITDSEEGVRFSNGWTKFVEDNSLQNGNSCTFQLIDRDLLSFKVTIRR